MGFSNQKKTEFERVRDWKRKNPEKVANQRKRKAARKRAEKRAQDPTGELNYGPIDGVDEPYPDSSEMPPAQKPQSPQEGIEEPPEFLAELEREHKRLMLERCRKELEGK